MKKVSKWTEMRGRITWTLLSLSVMAAVPAWAHPSDNDPLFMIGRGATITVQAPLNIKPGARYGLFAMTSARSPEEPVAFGGTVRCWATAKQSEEFDREIPSGTAFQVEEVLADSAGAAYQNGTDIYRVDLFVNSDSIKSITCIHNHYPLLGEGEKWVTIGDFKQTYGKLFGLKLAAPLVVR